MSLDEDVCNSEPNIAYHKVISTGTMSRTGLETLNSSRILLELLSQSAAQRRKFSEKTVSKAIFYWIFALFPDRLNHFSRLRRSFPLMGPCGLKTPRFS